MKVFVFETIFVIFRAIYFSNFCKFAQYYKLKLPLFVQDITDGQLEPMSQTQLLAAWEEPPKLSHHGGSVRHHGDDVLLQVQAEVLKALGHHFLEPLCGHGSVDPHHPQVVVLASTQVEVYV